MRYTLLILILFIGNSSYAQLFFNRFDSVQVTEENGTLGFPWAGGVNHAQFSNIDFDSDGRNDLLIFDKSGDKLICLRMNEQNQLTNAPQYREMFVNQHNAFRDRLHDWVLLRDFNADGKNDIFTYSNGGFAVYRNDGNSDTLIFTLMTSKLESDYGNGPINIYVSPTDLPAIADIDGDSDIDVVTFSLFGTAAEYHRNMSMELYGIADSLAFELDTPCWGDFEEDPSTVAISLDVSCKGGTYTPPTQQLVNNGGAHSGFTMLALDIEGDGDQDMVLSNVSFNTMNLLTNDGDATTAHMGLQDLTFPANQGGSSAIDLYTFPAAFIADVNNDGTTDLIATPYQENNGHDHEGCYLYTNSNSSGYNLTFQQNNFVQDEMIELGTSAYPVLFDYDKDGLKDLLIGNRGYFVSTGSYSSQLAYYRNTGTVAEPAFTLQTRNVANISSLGLGNVIPTFGDIDGDGDDDMIIGDADGLVHLFENSAGAGNECSFSLTVPGFQGIDIGGQYAAPQLFDVNGDDLLDLVIGERNGNLNLYLNQGTATAPQFVLDDTNWGGVDMRRNGLSFGYSVPHLYLNGGDIEMMVGSESGVIDIYNEIADVVNGPEELIAEVGDGTSFSTGNETTPFGFTSSSGRNQYLIRAEELTDAGLAQGVIEKLGVTTENGPSITHAQFYIKMGSTELNELSGFVQDLNTTYFVSTGNIAQGEIELINQTPFNWDGESNLIIEFCWFQVAGSGTDINVEYSTLPYSCNAFASTGNFSGCGIEYQGSNNERPNFSFSIKPSFRLKSEFPKYEGERAAVALADITDDELPELIIGNLAGGLAFYKGDTVGVSISSIDEIGADRVEMNLYPNPNNGIFTIEPHAPMSGNILMNVYNSLGQLVWSDVRYDIIRTSADLSTLQNGIYVLELRSENKSSIKRFVIHR